MKSELYNLLICPKCKNTYGLIPDSWKLNRDVKIGDIFFCSECMSWGRVMGAEMEIIREGDAVIRSYGTVQSTPDDPFDGFDFS